MGGEQGCADLEDSEELCGTSHILWAAVYRTTMYRPMRRRLHPQRTAAHYAGERALALPVKAMLMVQECTSHGDRSRLADADVSRGAVSLHVLWYMQTSTLVEERSGVCYATESGMPYRDAHSVTAPKGHQSL